MPIKLLLFALGVIAVSFFPDLPPLLSVLLCFPLFFVLWRRRLAHYWLALLLGVAWGVYSGHNLVSMQLPEELAGKDLIVTGQIQGIPEQDLKRIGFNFRVLSVKTTTGQSLPVNQFPPGIRLSWYLYKPDARSIDAPVLQIGEQWQLRVRLKRPRGFVNPAGFDYQAWLLRQGIGATGYVIDHRTNQRILVPVPKGRWDDWIDRQRHQLQQWVVAHSDSSERGILIALLIGDSSLVDKKQWMRMQQTGTSHLIAISGLHVGFLAIFGFYLGLWLGKCIQLIWHRCPVFMIAWCSAIFCAAFYSALAGFNIPTVRTLIMLVIFYIACLWRRSIRIADIFCCALALVMLIDPLAALDMGFWLSFGAVALLLVYFSGRLVPKQTAAPWSGLGVTNMVAGFIRSQWVMFIGLLVPLGLLVNSVSLVAPVANGLAIPLITFLVVPLLLVSAATRNLFGNVSDFLLSSAGWLMEILKIFLDQLLALAGPWSSPILAFSPALAALIGLSCCLLLAPKGLFPRALGWCGLLLGLGLSIFISPPNQTDLKLSVLDVGQGTAVVVQVKQHTLVYDTGPKYTDNFDAGSGIIAPYLFSQGINHIDQLVVSHSDMDHSGGLDGLLEKVSVKSLVAGEVEFIPGHLAGRDCHTTKPWRWNEIHFQFLSYPISPTAKSNNKSCVLLITYFDQQILLPGDIELQAENQLLAHAQFPTNIDLLLAAHHGSRTSSGARFIQRTTPAMVVYSAGYRSPHGHPHPQVRRAFQSIGSREWNTADSGAIVFKWSRGKLQSVTAYREFKHRYWFD